MVAMNDSLRALIADLEAENARRRVIRTTYPTMRLGASSTPPWQTPPPLRLPALAARFRREGNRD